MTEFSKTKTYMNKQNIHYGITLSEQQMEWIRSKKYKIDRMECFMSLVTLAERETKLVQVSKTQQVEILAGQFMVDNTQLAAMWSKDRKTVPKLLEAMEALGISSSQKVGEYRVHTLHSLAGWYVDGRYQKNPLSSKRSADGTQIIPMDVPPARVLTIEADAQQKTDAENGQSNDVNSAIGGDGKNPTSTTYPLPKIHNLMMVAMWASLMLAQNLPSLLSVELPHRRRLTAVLLLHLHLMKPMASRTKGSRMSEDNPSGAAFLDSQITAQNHLPATLEAMAAQATLEARLMPRNSPARRSLAVYTLQPYQRTFSPATLLRGSRHLCSPVGKFAAKSLAN